MPRAPSLRRREGARGQSPPRAAMMVTIATPGTPDSPLSPQAQVPSVPPEDCTVAQLREYTLHFLGHLQAKDVELARRQAQDAAQAQQTNCQLDRVVKRVQEADDAMLVRVQNLEHGIVTVKSEVDMFKAQMASLIERVDTVLKSDEALLIRTVQLEQEFQGHVRTEFNKLQGELSEVQRYVAQHLTTSTSATPTTTPTTTTTTMPRHMLLLRLRLAESLAIYEDFLQEVA